MNLDHLAHTIGRTHVNAQARVGLAGNRELNWRNWLIGACIVEYEQGGEDRAENGGKILEPWQTVSGRMYSRCLPYPI